MVSWEGMPQQPQSRQTRYNGMGMGGLPFPDLSRCIDNRLFFAEKKHEIPLIFRYLNVPGTICTRVPVDPSPGELSLICSV